MKITSIIIGLVVTATIFTSCGDTVNAEIKLETIQCGMCVNKIKNSVKKLDGISKFEIDFDKKIGYVSYNATILDLASIENAISLVGYNANKKPANQEAYNKLDACCRIPGK